MFVVDSYSLAVALCFVTMLCWGSWANTQKACGASWRFELFYWDYVWGVVLLAAVSAVTLGSTGEMGRSFWPDLKQADLNMIASAMLGGAVFNLANILLVAAIAIAGMAVAFPIGIGLALVIGVGVNYANNPKGDPVLLIVGVGLIVAAIILDAIAYRRLPGQSKGTSAKGITLSLLCGVLMGFFYWFVARTMFDDPANPAAGKLSPYTAVFLFTLGVFASNLLINPILMARPFVGEPLRMADYRSGSAKQHLLGVVGGIIWCVGMTLSIVSATEAGWAISYGLGQGATMVAAFWGVFIWREFREAPSNTRYLLALMFVGYIVGLLLIIKAGM